MKNTAATSRVCFFCPFGTNKKGQKKKKTVPLSTLVSVSRKRRHKKNQKLAKGTRENARMNSAVVV
jgi:hypothetical protein